MNVSLASMRTLLVEDDPVSAALARRTLADLGFEADLATTAEEALALHARQPYRIVISDWMLPGMDGIELCRRLRAATESYVYFLLCSGREDRATRLAAFDAGMDDFLGKPLDRDEVRARLGVAARILAGEDRVAEQLAAEERAAQETAELNETLLIASRRFEDLFNGLPVACFTYDETGCVHEWNQAAEDAFGVPAFDTLVRPVWDVLEAGGEVWTESRCLGLLARGGQEEFEWTYAGPDATREFACRMIALRGKGGRIVGAVVANVDMTTHKRAERLLSREKATLEDANARLHELASKDGLTGLWNRRMLMNELEKAVAEYHRVGKTFSLVLLDVDRFKQYNDAFGHPAGDEVLRRFARVLRHSARSYESPARYGGEEFAIVLHNTNVAKGLAASERFRVAVEEAEWTERDVTCSLGVATVGTNGDTVEEIVAAADAALYASKADGRNRCTHAAGLERLPQAA